MSNPLIAEVQDSTEAYSGIPLLESVFDTKQAIESGDWAAGVMGVVGTGLDMLGTVLDPFGSILAAGVGWLLEHVGPLSDALDALTGDPDVISSHAETWQNVGTELASISADLLKAVDEDTTTWTGPAADTYRQRGADTATLLQAAQSAAEGAGSGIATAGEVVAAVRTLVRDIVAELVGRLISWALQVVFTLGIGLTWVVPQVVNAVSKTALKITDLTTKLIEAMGKLGPLLAKLGDKFREASTTLKKIKSGDPGNPRSVEGGNTTPSGFGGTSGERGGSGGGSPRPDHQPRSDSGTTDTTTSGSSTPPPHQSRSGNTTPSSGQDTRNTNVSADDRNCAGDPVDVATGEVIVAQIDLTLPDLPLPALERTHVSSYREGRWFGPSWSSTLDQRLEIRGETVRYFAPDGMILTYPLPSPTASALPEAGPPWPLSRHADGRWTLEKRPARHTLQFAGSGSVLPLRAVEGPDGQRSELTYDEAGAPAVLAHSSGVRMGFRVEGSRVTELAVLGTGGLPDVLVMRYRYDGHGRLTDVVNSSNGPQRFDYDPHGRVTGWQDRNGVWYRYVYDSAGRCVRTVGTDGFLDGVFVYDTERRVTTHTDSLGRTTVYELNEAHQTVRETDPLGNVTAFEWNGYNQLLARTDPLGRVTRYDYDADGLPVSITRPDGSVVSLDHSNDTLTSFTVVENGRTWTGHYTDTAPDPVREPVGVATALDVSAVPTPGPLPGGEEDRDQFGRPRSIPSPGGGRVLLGWTVDGARATRISPHRARAVWQYDGEGNEIAHVDELGHVTRREYGPFDLLTAEVDPAGARTEYRYDTELRLVSVTDPLGRIWSYRYDAAGRLAGQTDFDGRVWTYEHDAAGQVVRATQPDGQVVEYGYDLLGNLVELRTPHGSTRYDYDPAGEVVRVTSADSVVEFERDEDGRVVREVVDGLAVTFAYDAERNTIRRRTPSGVESEWSFDESDRPVTLRTEGHAVRYLRDAAGRIVRRDTDGRSVLAQSFGAGEHVEEQTLSTGGIPLQRRAFEYQADGKLAALRDEVAGNLALTRDAAGRIVTDGRDTFRYDPAGNLAAWSSSPGLALDDDALGRRIRCREATPGGERIWEYSWTGELLTGLRTSDGHQWRYRYDPLGRRIAKERLLADGSVAESVRFVWDGTTLIEQIHVDEHGITRSTTWERLPTEHTPVTQLERGPGGERFHSVVTDALGTPTALVDEAGALAWVGRRSVWGRVPPSPAAATSIPLRFPGQYADEESGLHYNVFRYYDPVTARYLSQDPLGMEAGPNPTAYVTDPFSEFDALGLMNCSKNSSGSNPPSTNSPAQHNANNAGGSANTPAQPGGKRKKSAGNSANPQPAKKPKKQPGPWDRADFNNDTLKDIKTQKKNNPDYSGGNVHARHIVSFQTMRDSLRTWVDDRFPVGHPQRDSMIDEYSAKLDRMNSNIENLPLGPGAPNSSIGGVVNNFDTIEKRIDGRFPSDDFAKDSNGNFVLDSQGNRIPTMEPPMAPSEAFDKSSGYYKNIRDEFGKPIMEAADTITDPAERKEFLSDVRFSADFDWPGGAKQEFKQWKNVHDEIVNIGENPGDYTAQHVDEVIDRFLNLNKPSGAHESWPDWQARPK
ncbi:DUF6531 domain-containing protein [Saccharomonospora azurea]